MPSLYDKNNYVDPEIEVYIVSYPKSGRTWLRVLLGRYLCESYRLDEGDLLDIRTVTTAAQLLKTQFTHDSSSIVSANYYQDLLPDKSAYGGKQVIFLIRGLKDILVSSFFQATLRVGRFDGDIHEFVRDDRFGAQKVATFNAHWYAAQSVPKNFLLIRYETLHRDPHCVLLKTLQLIGVVSPSVSTLKSAIRYGRFDNLRELEESNHFNTEILRPGNREDNESFKIRKGRVGGYTEYLNSTDISYIDSVIRCFDCPFVY